MSKERILEVARLIDDKYRGMPQEQGSVVRLLESLPEFQSHGWVQCSERMPELLGTELNKTRMHRG